MRLFIYDVKYYNVKIVCKLLSLTTCQKKYIKLKNMVEDFSKWICCQLGAREHYAIPRALYKTGQLANLITDAWVLPQSPLNLLPKPILANLRDRYHADLAQASVIGFTSSIVKFELTQHIQNNLEWERMIARNSWFQENAINSLEKINSQLNFRPILFSYSYAALELFRYAKKKGWRTVLGQVNPGILEEQLVLQEHIKRPNYVSKWQLAPPQYWTNWREECSYADIILVNSLWSKHALEQAKIPSKKIEVVPLAYEAPESAQNFLRIYPSVFSSERPLRVLFLGQIVLRKGIAAILDAAQILQNQPIEFWLVGCLGISKPPQSSKLKNLRWIGSIPRSFTDYYYRKADIFLLPTISDGFGLTQLEAQSWKLPIIASNFCGNVVKHEVNGILLPTVTGESIANALLFCLKNPQTLQAFAQESTKNYCHSLLQLQHHLETLTKALA